MEILRRVGLNVRQARLVKGWSQEELAHRADLHRTYISQVERGVKNATMTSIEKVAKALGTTPGRLIDREPFN
jgi:transcriptional regulator with XRE-family HTH domain